MHEEFSGSFPDYTVFISKFKTDECFLVYKMETFENCKEVKYIVIMITDYVFLSYVTFDQQLEINFRKSSGPPEKIYSPFFTHSP